MKDKEEFGSISVRLIPVIEKIPLPDDKKPLTAYREHEQPFNPNEVEIKEFKAELTIPEGIRDALKNYEEINREYRTRYKKEGKDVVLKLLERHPEFAEVRWVQKALKEKPIKSGRKFGDTWISRTTIQALVDTLIERGYAKSDIYEFLSSELGITRRHFERLYSEAKEFNKTLAVPSMGRVICQYVSSSKIYNRNPECMMKEAIQNGGKEAAKRALVRYIEEVEETLNNKTTRQVDKNAINHYQLLEKAKSLLAQIS